MKLKVNTWELGLMQDAFRYYAAYLRTTRGHKARHEIEMLNKCSLAVRHLVLEGGIIKVVDDQED